MQSLLENANMDVLQDSSLSERSLSPEQPVLELKDRFTSGSGCSEQVVVQNSEMTGDTQMGSSGVSIGQCHPNSFKSLKILDDSTKKLSFEPLELQDLQFSFQCASASAVPLDQKEATVDENNRTKSAGMGIEVSELAGLEKSKQSIKGINLNSNMEQMRAALEDRGSKSATDDPELQNEKEAIISSFDNLGSAPVDASGNLCLQQAEVRIAGESGLVKGTPIQSRKRRSKVMAPVTTRVLRSRSQEKSKAPEPNVVEVEGSAKEERRSKRRKKNRMKNLPVNEFSRIRAHLRYLLHRIKYEQNLIDAYSGEGWKGQSLEKIKPEKELQRAKHQIFRYKLKTRDLFQQLDISLTQGKLPGSLFDSEGQIDSEDIFCAKCGSKDLTAHNDIILCDGACERGFHQFCLEPPLLNDDIPPDDEGWLCPGCDCKVDCVEMLNDFQGSNLSILDNWEKVYPEEAAAAASGKNMNENSGLPSDDSEDDDYNPDNPEPDHNFLEDKSSSGESEYFSASDDLVPLNNQQFLGLPSDDSDDDDFEPGAPDPDQHAKLDSSSSDFTSDSEDLGAVVDKSGSQGNDDRYILSASDQSKPNVGMSEEKLEAGKVGRKSLNDELLYLLESNDAPVSGKRHVERLDYKKLHDETYGYTSSDSSDEDYGETAVSKRRKNNSGRAIPSSANEVRGRNTRANMEDGNHNQDESKQMLKNKTHQNLEVEGSNNLVGDLQRSCSEVGSSAKNATRPYRRLGESVVQRLLESFKENQYPKQDVKESLAEELGLRIQQVSKWFENARWSFHHSSRMDKMRAGSASRNGISTPQGNEKSPEFGPSVLQNPSGNKLIEMPSSQDSPGVEECHDTDAGKRIPLPEGSGEKSNTVESGKRGWETGDQVLNQPCSVEMAPKRDDGNVDTMETGAVRRSSRLQFSSKSVL